MSFKILIVDDSIPLQTILKRHLKNQGFEDVSAVATGEEALVMLEEAHYDIVILDINLPGIDGWQVLDKIRTYTPGTKVLMITGGNIDKRETVSRGAFDLLLKPFSADEFKAVFNFALSSDLIDGAPAGE